VTFLIGGWVAYALSGTLQITWVLPCAAGNVGSIAATPSQRDAHESSPASGNPDPGPDPTWAVGPSFDASSTSSIGGDGDLGNAVTSVTSHDSTFLRGMSTTGRQDLLMGRIIVGIDGSEHAQRALAWAAQEAAAHGSTLVAVYVYETHPSWQAYAYGETMSATELEAVRQRMQDAAEQARAHAHAVVERTLRDAEMDERIPTESVVVEGHRPAQELVRLSADADLLVVGSRGRGGFAGLLLGSVSQQCATHAGCPVTIVRPEPA
jgi:nucleotide-binding universal stress UspA family protein